jgi:hypothetical protein
MQPKSIVGKFVNALATFRIAESTIAIRISNDPSLELLDAGTDVEGFDWLAGIDQSRSYDFVVVDLPLGMGRKKIEIGGSTISVRGNWVALSKALRMLASDGLCVAIVEPPAFGISEGPEFQKALATEGFYLNGVFNAPQNLLSSTAIRPVIVAFSREKRSSLFVAEL